MTHPVFKGIQTHIHYVAEPHLKRLAVPQHTVPMLPMLRTTLATVRTSTQTLIALSLSLSLSLSLVTMNHPYDSSRIGDGTYGTPLFFGKLGH